MVYLSDNQIREHVTKVELQRTCASNINATTFMVRSEAFHEHSMFYMLVLMMYYLNSYNKLVDLFTLRTLFMLVRN